MTMPVASMPAASSSQQQPAASGAWPRWRGCVASAEERNHTPAPNLDGFYPPRVPPSPRLAAGRPSSTRRQIQPQQAAGTTPTLDQSALLLHRIPAAPLFWSWRALGPPPSAGRAPPPRPSSPPSAVSGASRSFKRRAIPAGPRCTARYEPRPGLQTLTCGTDEGRRAKGEGRRKPRGSVR